MSGAVNELPTGIIVNPHGLPGSFPEFMEDWEANRWASWSQFLELASLGVETTEEWKACRKVKWLEDQLLYLEDLTLLAEKLQTHLNAQYEAEELSWVLDNLLQAWLEEPSPSHAKWRVVEWFKYRQAEWKLEEPRMAAESGDTEDDFYFWAYWLEDRIEWMENCVPPLRSLVSGELAYARHQAHK
jgi:hypothetical protein